jgi:dolichol-phosphate mannosyltransferase
MLVSIIFSFRNEEAALPELVKRVENLFVEHLKGYKYELIFVNDDSTDKSLEILMGLRERNKNIKIINMARRFGVTPCVMAGFSKAKGDAVIYMDSDLQDPPELIPELIKKWEEGAEVVHTIRTKRHGENFLKLWLTKKAYKIINYISDIELHENAGDFKLLSRRVVDEILRLKESDPYMRGISRWIGFKQAEVFYERDTRFAGESKFKLFNSLNPYKEFIRGITSFSSMPLYFALFFGFFVSAISFVYVVVVIITKLLEMNLPGWSAIMAAILFVGGTILFTIGVLGIYLGKIYDEVKGRPRFIIRDKFGFD